MKKLTRMECNKEARRVLNRHGVDLAYCQFTCYGNEVRLTGWLCKTDATDYTGPLIEAIVHDFHRSLPGFMIYGEFDNWNFTSERIQFLGERKNAHLGGGVEEEVDVYHIDLDDYDFEAS